MGLAFALLCGSLSAQAPDPANWEFEVRTPNDSQKPGDAFQATIGMVSRLAGPQGWSYGLKHDATVLDAEKVTADGTETMALFSGGFNQTVLIENAGTKIGFIQAIILSFVQPIVVPVDDYFTMALADYKVKAGACDGKNGNFTTKLEFTTELAVPNSPPVDINVTVEGKSLVPSKLTAKNLTIQCESVGEGGLALKFDKTDTDLVADKASLYDLKVQVTNTQTAGGFDVQGWSYGVRLDAAELEPTAGEPGVDAKALKGGKGPDFTNYALDERNTAGSVRGVTVGVVIDLDSPANNVLAVGAGATKHLDTIKLRTRNEIAAGGQSKTTQLGFSDQLGGDRPLEVLMVVAGNGIVPDFADTTTLTLLPRGGGGDEPSFIRGDANDDRRVDIADGIWIVNFLFYGGTATACLPAADANSDNQRNVSDAMFIFNYQLQPGKAPGSQLFPAPAAPFPNCGTAAGVTLADCPRGSTQCSQ